ncbi:MAG: NAD(P)H-hydrate dehydratase [Methylococcaceae bacterium]|nr:NAD(P)H-hydrate dehydratase [Methylococcaceae bacterium]
MRHLSKPLYRAAQIRQAESTAIEKLQIPGLKLMRNAGKAAFTELQRHWPDRRKLMVFCGAGNNGGDGYVIARLALLSGYAVSVYAMGDEAVLKGDALTSHRDFINAGGTARTFSADLPLADGIIVDALLGTGLNRQVGDDYSKAIATINAANCPVLAVDVPSGLHADTGCVLGCAVKADLTITFIGLKSGLFTGQAADYCGEIVLADLAVPETVFTGMVPAAHLLTKTPLPQRPRSAHKGHFGHVLLVGGNFGYSGAIRLAGEAALRSGAGLVSIASRAGHSAMLNIGRPELMCHGVEYRDQLQALLDKASVVVIGPGLGQDEWAQSLFSAVLATDKPCVIDADALNLLAKQPGKRGDWILTPHPGEAARLLACSTRDIAADRFAAVSGLQNRYGGVCVLKGAGSLIADAQTIHVATTGNPGMASGGMGDVLAGLVGGLLAQGLSPTDAAKLAVYVHGEAADRTAEQGQRGMLASDLLPQLRCCLNDDMTRIGSE